MAEEKGVVRVSCFLMSLWIVHVVALYIRDLSSDVGQEIRPKLCWMYPHTQYQDTALRKKTRILHWTDKIDKQNKIVSILQDLRTVNTLGSTIIRSRED